MKVEIFNEIMELEPSTLITLYEIVLKDPETEEEIPSTYKFHAGENGYGQPIYFGDGLGSDEYFYLPCQAGGFDYEDETLPRPTLKFDNTDGFFSLKTRYFKDFVGFDVRRTKTFVKFLHGRNFPNNTNPFGSPTEASYPIEKYTINKKTVENSDFISFELVSRFEKDGGLVPARKIVHNVCGWKYRHAYGCGYSGPPVTDKGGNTLSHNQSAKLNVTASVAKNLKWSKDKTYNTNETVSIYIEEGDETIYHLYVCQNDGIQSNPLKDKKNWVQDMCPKNILGCRARFGIVDGVNKEKNNGLPFGGFPGSHG